MKLLKMGALRGPNVYSHHCVICLDIDLGDMHGRTSDQIEGFNESLLGLIPSLGEHFCSLGKFGGFLERLQEGTMLGHVIEHLALELQAQLGYEVFFGRTRLKGSHYSLVYEYQCEEVGLWAGKEAFRIIKKLAYGRPLTSLERILEKGNRVKKNYEFGPSTQSIIRAAKKRNIPILALGKGTSLLQLGYGKSSKRVRATITENTSCLGVDIAGDKWQVRNLLTGHGFPFPLGELVENLAELYRGARKLGFPLVIKPYNCNQGKGVTLNIQSLGELEQAYFLAKKFSPRILLEKNVIGKDYRIMIVAGKVVAVSERIPPFILGDGRHTVRQLINSLNSDPQRGYGHEKILTKIKIDELVRIMLKKQGHTEESCPGPGEKVILRANGNLSTGGTAFDVTDHIHPDNKELAIRAAQIIGLDICGVDLVAPDISRPILESGGYFIEINAAPGIRMHHYPSGGKARDVAGALVDYLFPKPHNGRIPLVAVTGTNGKTTVTRFIAHVLEEYGLAVGYGTTEGLFFAKTKIISGDCTGPNSARDILTDPRVEAGVLETARGGILRGGLGFDWVDVAVITNITEDHFDDYYIRDLSDLWHVKSLIIERVKEGGSVVLNADDPFLLEMVSRVDKKMILFSKQAMNMTLKKHLHNGGEGIFLRNNMIVYRRGRWEEELVDIRDVPITWGGQAKHQVENTLASLAAAVALGIPKAVIKKALLSFDHSLNPGRLELLGNAYCRVVLDYGHNEEGFANVLRTVKRLPHKRLLGVLGMPGDRRDDSIIKAASLLAGEEFHKVYLKEDDDPRGRQRGEVANILARVFLQEGFSGELEIVLSEEEAIIKALNEAREGDIVLIFYGKEREIVERLIEQEIRSKTRKILVSQE